MLTIGISDGYELNWHIGEKKPEIWQARTSQGDIDLTKPSRRVVFIQADGHELEKIRADFTNIPMANQRVVVWVGEMAQFIWENLQ